MNWIQTLPNHISCLGEVYQRQWQWSDAEAEFKRALELNPNDARAHERLRDVAPVPGADGRGPWRGSSVPASSTRLEAPAERMASYCFTPDVTRRPSGNCDPTRRIGIWAFPLIANGQPDEAITVLEKALAGSGRDSATMGVLVRAYAHAGRRSEALRLLDELQQRQLKGYVPTAAFVNAYLGLGENEQAFVWLEKAYKEQSNILGLLKVHPYFDPLRGDPRFADLVHRVGLDQPR